MEQIKKEELGYRLKWFLTEHSLDAIAFAKSVGIQTDRLNKLLASEQMSNEKEYSEVIIAMAIIEVKGFDYYKSMSQEDKSELACKFIAAGGSTMTVGGMIAVISAAGVPGLSAAGIASGLAAIGALVGGGMVAGIALCSAAPLVVGGTLYAICKKGKQPIVFIKNKFKKAI